MKKITILIPCYNEEQSLLLLYHALQEITTPLKQYQWEYLFVNDGSLDNTLEIIKQLRRQNQQVSYVDLSRNFGKENAMLAGFDYAVGDAVIILDADLQDPPSLIPKMITEWENGYQDVYAKRRNRGAESFFRKNLSLLFYKILDHSTRFEILQNVGDFRLLDRQCVNALCHLRETERYTKGIYCWIGYRKKELIFDRQNRQAGSSKWNFFSLLELAIEGITSFTITPLRISTFLGIFVALGAICAGLFYLIKTLFFGDVVRGFTTLVVLLLFLGGTILFSIGILGEYIGRIFNEVKSRPVYLATEYNNTKITQIK